VQTIVVAVAIGLLITIAYSDVRTRRIPNALAAAIAILGLSRMILADDPVAAGHTVVASAAVFAVTFLLFWRGVFGGGDAKLISTTVMLVGFRDVFDFFFLMSLCGGTLALAILTCDRFRLHRRHIYQGTTEAGSSGPPTPPTVPYGVAIAGAGVVILILRPVL
jgi:Flp pilus assembly protein protease CpaA